MLGDILTAIIALTVFNLGLPAVVLELADPFERRGQALRYLPRVFPWPLLFEAFLIVSSVAVATLWYHVGPDDIDKCQRLAVVILLAVCLMVTFANWLICVRTSVVSRLATVLLNRSLRSSPRSPGFRTSMWHLIELGIRSDPDFGKSHVIDALREIVRSTFGKGYTDLELEELWRRSAEVVLNASNPGNDRNLRDFVPFVEQLLTAVPAGEEAQLIHQTVALEILRQVGVKAAQSMLLTTVTGYLRLAENHSGILFEMGVAALSAARFNVVQSVLNRLESLAERSLPMRAGEDTFYLIGFLCHLRSSENQTLRNFANSYFFDDRRQFAPSLRDCLAAARGHFINKGRFETVDKIADALAAIC